MRQSLMIIVAASALIVLATAGTAEAIQWNHRCGGFPAECYPWHGGYYNVAWGMPVALVVPPNVETQTHWGWGVGSTRVTPIRHQFRRDWPGQGQYDRSSFRPTPHWPSHTDQFGTYHIRGPW